MEIVKLDTQKQIEQFIDCAKGFYLNDKEYIPHLRQDLIKLFSVETNPLLKTGEFACWLLFEKKTIIGRIAAFYSQDHKENGAGGIGFFECIDKQEAANLLFSEAEKWLQSKGFTQVDGPINFGERDKYWGLLVEGFKHSSYQENYNPPYYQKLFEKAGYSTLFKQTTSELSLDTFKSERFIKLSSRVFQNPDYSFAHYRRKEKDKFAADFVHIYNKAWASRPDFVPITSQRVMMILEELEPIVVEEAIWFAYAKGEPAGFYVNVIDVNQLFKHVDGNLNLFGKLKFVLAKLFTKVSRMRGIVFGVIPQYQNLGLETGMIIKMYEAMLKIGTYTSCELSWIGDFNPKMHSLFNALGATTSKVHITYRKIIS